MSTAKLTGRITVHGGDKPARTAVVELHNAAGDVVDQVMVDDEGRYVYHLSSGTWTLAVWDEHGHRGRADVTIAEGEDKSLDVDLDEPEGGH
ncbi:MAG: carboxypeptidase regulatory-like domain-containing protein [Actinomycetota bacterium]